MAGWVGGVQNAARRGVGEVLVEAVDVEGPWFSVEELDNKYGLLTLQSSLSNWQWTYTNGTKQIPCS